MLVVGVGRVAVIALAVDVAYIRRCGRAAEVVRGGPADESSGAQ